MAPKQRIDKTLRENVWRTHFGSKGEGVCVICQREVTVWAFDVCHRQSRKNGGTLDLENLEVGCHECNIRQGSMDLDDYLKIRVVSSFKAEKSTGEAPSPADTKDYSSAWLLLEAAKKQQEKEYDANANAGRSGHGCLATSTRLDHMDKILKSAHCILGDLSLGRIGMCDLSARQERELKQIMGLKIELERITGLKIGENGIDENPFASPTVSFSNEQRFTNRFMQDRPGKRYGR